MTKVASNMPAGANEFSQQPVAAPNNDAGKTESREPETRKTDVRPKEKNLGRYSGDQELEPFAQWVGDSIWVPPKDSNADLAKSMLRNAFPFSNKDRLWAKVEKEHRSKFTHVRQIELPRASIRLPQGRLFVSVTERKNFSEIEEAIPNCVQTRLDEFLRKYGRRRDVEVYYLKPLCVESGNQLVFTTQRELNQARETIRSEVFSEYRKRYLPYWMGHTTKTVINSGLAVPRSMINLVLNRKRKEIEAYHAKLEFERRKRALEANEAYQQYRTLKCSFDEILSMTKPLDRADVIDQYVSERELDREQQRQLFLLASAATMPWFVTLAIGHALALTIGATMAVSLCDPAFVAVMPGCKKTLFKIGHFDEVDGVMHVEI